VVFDTAAVAKMQHQQLQLQQQPQSMPLPLPPPPQQEQLQLQQQQGQQQQQTAAAQLPPWLQLVPTPQEHQQQQQHQQLPQLPQQPQQQQLPQQQQRQTRVAPPAPEEPAVLVQWDFKSRQAMLQKGGKTFYTRDLVQAEPKRGDSSAVMANFWGKLYRVHAVWWKLVRDPAAKSTPVFRPVPFEEKSTPDLPSPPSHSQPSQLPPVLCPAPTHPTTTRHTPQTYAETPSHTLAFPRLAMPSKPPRIQLAGATASQRTL
jgi:hypothetical protein